MGYDMYLCAPDGTDIDGDRDQTYFRLNIFGMGQMRQDMFDLGMLATDSTPPPWPEPEQFNLTLQQIWDADDSFDADSDLGKFDAAQKAILSWVAPDEPGIAAHKFSSNDGWHVSSAECKAALTMMRANPDDTITLVKSKWDQPDGSNYFDEWVAFLERAEKCGGFKVY